MIDFLLSKTSTLKEYLSLLPLPWQPTTAQLNSPHIFIFSYIDNFNSVCLFHPVLTWISMEIGRSCRARWWIAVAAHNIRVLIGQIICQSSSLRMVNWLSLWMGHWFIDSLDLFKNLNSFSNETPLCVAQRHNSSAVALIRTIFVSEI